MSTRVFMDLVHAVIAYNHDRSIRHVDIIKAAREVMRDPMFKVHVGLYNLTPRETAALPCESYPNGIYSFDTVEFLNARRYIVILRLNDSAHLYIKLMLDDMDSSIIRFRLAYVTYDGFLTTHHDLELGTEQQIRDHLIKQGVDLCTK